MAESTQQKRRRDRRRVVGLVLILVALAATTAYAATVTQAPTITGTPQTGSEVTATGGSWTPTDAQASYDWFRCNAAGASCDPIPGACGARYKVRTADETHTLRVRLTVKDASGDEDARESAAVGPVVPDPSPYAPSVGASDTCVKVTTTGRGQGTFSSGTQVPASSEPAADTTRPFIDPFPVVRVSGRFKGRRTTLTRVTVRTPIGTRIRSRCGGRSCPWRRRALTARFIRIRSLQRTYRPRTTIEIRITEPRKIGKYTRIRTRRGKSPTRLDRCLMPGETEPVKCPQG